jgi:hypothetical protein
MRVTWWGVVLIGTALVVAGTYAILASQNEINYVKSCEKPVSCGTAGGNPLSRPFLTSPLITSLQDAQAGWVVGITALGLGLAGITYGAYVYLGRTETSTVGAGSAPPR